MHPCAQGRAVSRAFEQLYAPVSTGVGAGAHDQSPHRVAGARRA
jgi:hypothetical protein